MFNAHVYRLPHTLTHMHTFGSHSDATGIVSHHRKREKIRGRDTSTHKHTQPTDINKDFSVCNIFSLSPKRMGQSEENTRTKANEIYFSSLCVYTFDYSVSSSCMLCRRIYQLAWISYVHVRLCARVCVYDVYTTSKLLKDKTTCMCSILEYICFFLLLSSVLLGS